MSRLTRAGAADCDVIIIGGGPVGLFLACELGAYGLEVELFEQQASTSVHPKANTHSARSLEFYRRHGLTEAFRASGWPVDRPTDIVYRTRVLGHELGRVEMPSPAEALAAAERGNERWPTPEPQLRASQLRLEPLLRACAESHPRVRLAFSSEVVAFEQDDDGVTVRVKATTGTRTRRASFLVACDGARSSTRGRIGLAFEGEGGLELEFMGGTMVTTFFRAPSLLGLMSGRPAWQIWTLNAERRNLLVSLDGAEHFVLHSQLESGQRLENFDFSAVLSSVVGQAIPHEPISAAPWRAGRALVAAHYGRGRAALAGDAAHLFTPTGGLGVNTGIEDVANLAWKLAGAIEGWAGKGLLASYERERKPIAERNTRFALSLAQAVSACPIRPEMEDASEAGVRAREAARLHIAEVARNEFDHPGLQLGSRYDRGGLVFSDDVVEAVHGPRLTYEPTMSPGGRIPHAWIALGRSLLDLCGHRFTLLELDATRTDAATFAGRAESRGIPFASHVLDRPDLVDRFGVTRVLVRPDQIVAWSGSGPALHDDAVDAILDLVTGHRAPGRGTFDCADSPPEGRTP